MTPEVGLAGIARQRCRCGEASVACSAIRQFFSAGPDTSIKYRVDVLIGYRSFLSQLVVALKQPVACMAFPREHWARIRTNNVLERIIREIRRRTRAVGNFPDGKSALMLVAARVRNIVGTKRGRRVYLDMARLSEVEQTADEVTVA